MTIEKEKARGCPWSSRPSIIRDCTDECRVTTTTTTTISTTTSTTTTTATTEKIRQHKAGILLGSREDTFDNPFKKVIYQSADEDGDISNNKRANGKDFNQYPKIFSTTSTTVSTPSTTTTEIPTTTTTEIPSTTTTALPTTTSTTTTEVTTLTPTATSTSTTATETPTTATTATPTTVKKSPQTIPPKTHSAKPQPATVATTAMQQKPRTQMPFSFAQHYRNRYNAARLRGVAAISGMLPAFLGNRPSKWQNNNKEKKQHKPGKSCADIQKKGFCFIVKREGFCKMERHRMYCCKTCSGA